jgi:hypothetical protein
MTAPPALWTTTDEFFAALEQAQRERPREWTIHAGLIRSREWTIHAGLIRSDRICPVAFVLGVATGQAPEMLLEAYGKSFSFAHPAVAIAEDMTFAADWGDQPGADLRYRVLRRRLEQILGLA